MEAHTDTTVSKELLLCHQQYGWNLDKIKDVLIAGFKSSFLPYREKSDLLKEINEELAAVVEPESKKGEKTDKKKGKKNDAVASRKPDFHEAGCVTLSPTTESPAVPTTEIGR